jgi:hypothetical protein
LGNEAHNVNTPIFTSDDLPDQESGVRRMKADAEEASCVSFKSLADAKSHREGVVVCSDSKVRRSEETLRQLLLELDAKTWNSPDMAHIFQKRQAVGEGVAGGTGGAVAGTEIWIHQEFHTLGLAETFQEVIEGRRSKL